MVSDACQTAEDLLWGCKTGERGDLQTKNEGDLEMKKKDIFGTTWEYQGQKSCGGLAQGSECKKESEGGQVDGREVRVYPTRMSTKAQTLCK